MNRKGLNRAVEREYYIFENAYSIGVETYSKNDPCIFISHKKEDKNKAKELVDYIKDSGIDVYFDENDTLLNNPDIRKDPLKTTQAINKALERSTHMICIISNFTLESWWVPYEIGYACNKSNYFYSKIRALFTKDYNIPKPEYLEIVNRITTTNELDMFLKQVSQTQQLLNETKVEKFSVYSPHKLKSILR